MAAGDNLLAEKPDAWSHHHRVAHLERLRVRVLPLPRPPRVISPPFAWSRTLPKQSDEAEAAYSARLATEGSQMTMHHARLANCPHCNAEVEAASKTCRYCGKSLKQAPSKRQLRLKSDRRWAAWMMAGFFVATLVAVSLISQNQRAATSPAATRNVLIAK